MLGKGRGGNLMGMGRTMSIMGNGKGARKNTLERIVEKLVITLI